MNKNLPMEVFSPFSLENVWIFENKQYRYYGEKHLPYSLPTVSLEYEAALKENGTPYRIKDDCCEYWSPEHFEKEKVEAPLYAKIGNVYRCTKSYTGVVPSEQSVEAAQKTKDIVNFQIEQMRLYQKIKEILPEGKSSKSFYGLHRSVLTKVSFNGESFLILPIENLKFTKEYTGWNIIVDINLIKSKLYLKIGVPKGRMGLFIGTGGWQAKEISKELNKRIDFVEEA